MIHPIFFTLLNKIIPLYMNIALGYIAGKVLDTNRESIARFMFFLINPIIIFNGVMNVNLDLSVLSLPVLTFVISSCLCLLFFRMTGDIWTDSSRNLMAFSAGSGNTGYFGLPIALLLFNDEGEGIYILALLGITLYENSVGYYVLAHGSTTRAECIKKVIRLPAIYAFLGALILNFCGLEMPQVLVEFTGHIKGTYTVLGMMIVGLGLAGLTQFKVDAKFIGLSFFAKFIVWPVLMLIITGLDAWIFGIYSPMTHKALMLLSIVPLAVNTVIVATLMKSQPEKAATAVLLSTLFALAYVPLMVAWFII
jgi:predicted permease